MTLQVTSLQGGVQFAVKAVPGSSRDRIVGVLGTALKVQVAAPPERGRANARLCATLAAALQVAVSSVRVVAGDSSAHKRIQVDGLDADELRRRLGLG